MGRRAGSRAARGRRGLQSQRDGDRGTRASLTAYFDTSAVVKLILPEPGTAPVATVWLHAQRRMSTLALYPEARAALARAVRAGRISRQTGERARTRLEALWEVVIGVRFDEPLARRAGDLAAQLGLRAYDAVHLASLEGARDAKIVFVSADLQLARAASHLGFTVANPLA